MRQNWKHKTTKPSRDETRRDETILWMFCSAHLNSALFMLDSWLIKLKYQTDSIVSASVSRDEWEHVYSSRWWDDESCQKVFEWTEGKHTEKINVQEKKIQLRLNQSEACLYASGFLRTKRIKLLNLSQDSTGQKQRQEAVRELLQLWICIYAKIFMMWYRS